MLAILYILYYADVILLFKLVKKPDPNIQYQHPKYNLPCWSFQPRKTTVGGGLIVNFYSWNIWVSIWAHIMLLTGHIWKIHTHNVGVAPQSWITWLIKHSHLVSALCLQISSWKQELEERRKGGVEGVKEDDSQDRNPFLH